MEYAKNQNNMKHLIKIETPEHGVLSVQHAGRDSQYSEAGETIILDWQPDPKWGLQEAHYTDEGGNVTAIDLTTQTIEGRKVVAFTMPDSAITIGATFKRFVIEDWTGKGAPFTIVGSYATADLPVLNGMADAGKMAYNLTLKQYVVWNGEGWTDMSGNPVTPSSGNYLTFTAGEGGASLAFFFNRNNAGDDQQNPNITFQKSTDGGLAWEEHTIGVYDPDDGDTSDLDVITLGEGESVMFKGVNSESFTVGDPENDEGVYVGFYLDGGAAASGDITSLINGVGGDATVQFMQFYSMFIGCTGLTAAPALPATTLAEYCYYSMFSDCTGLTAAPALPATTLASNCYFSMFSGCTGLTAAPALPATTLAEYCYYSMFSDCTGLTAAPALPATTLAEYCYNSMFSGCTGLTQAPALPATTLAKGCYTSMFSGCTGITSHDVATLNNSSNTFQSNTSCASLTIHAETPPTIASNTITGLKATCRILVPAEAVDAYKAKQYWSARASYIEAMPE